MRAFISGFKEGFLESGRNLNGIVNAVLLSAVYIVGVGLTSIAARLLGKRFLQADQEGRDTYWEEYHHDASLDESYRQF